MKEFLRKIKLIDNHTLELKIQKAEFTVKLRKLIDEKKDVFFMSFFYNVLVNDNRLQGEVTSSKFEIYELKNSIYSAKANGEFYQKGEDLIVKTEIKCSVLPLFINTLIALLIISFALIIQLNEDMNYEFGIPILLIHLIALLGIPHFVMKRSISNLKYNLNQLYCSIANKPVVIDNSLTNKPK